MDSNGPAMTTSEQRERRRAALRQRLLGDGPIRTDPKTGTVYDTRPGGPKLAYAYVCDQCDGFWLASMVTHRLAKGTCSACRTRIARDKVTLPDGTTRPSTDGYVQVKQDGAWRLQHRVVMEQTLGRALRDDETVHHISGVRHDNRIENLQLRQGQHGRGAAMCCGSCGSQDIVPAPLGVGTAPGGWGVA